MSKALNKLRKHEMNSAAFWNELCALIDDVESTAMAATGLAMIAGILALISIISSILVWVFK